MNRPTPKIEWFQKAFSRLEDRIRPPERVNSESGISFRYKEKSTQQAILQKTARYISGLQAGTVLLNHGFLQELGALQRTLDEFLEDILFLTNGNINGLEETHDKYLQAFWEEEPENYDHPNRHQVPRKKIRAYIARITNNGSTDSGAIAVAGTVARTFSGFVHGASPHIMEMYDPNSKKFQLMGINNPFLLEDHKSDFENVWFRGIIVVAHCAIAVDDQQILEEATNLHSQLAPNFH